MGWQPEQAIELRPLQLDAHCLPLLSRLPWPALGRLHHPPWPQEALHGAHPGGLCRSGGVRMGWDVRTPAASLACVPQGWEKGLWGPW